MNSEEMYSRNTDYQIVDNRVVSRHDIVKRPISEWAERVNQFLDVELPNPPFKF